ncbi:MAG: M50 family metallopeptidase [Eubacteriales bacterium]
MANKKRKNRISPIIIQLVFGFVFGLVLGIMIVNNIENDLPLDKFLLNIAILWIGLILMYYISIIIHEAGHLVFGLATGYGFSSFRIGIMMLTKENGKLKVKKFYVPGTSGQCLMTPPEMHGGKMPYVLYNLGGAIMNLIFAAIFAILYFVFKGTGIFSLILAIGAMVNLLPALMNGIPLRLNLINNDAHNALSASKSETALRSFRVQLLVNDLTFKGVRLKDMPEELFYLPSDEEMKNSLNATIGALCCNRLMDMHEFDSAAVLMEKFISSDTGMVGLNRNLLIFDSIFCELIGENRKERISSLFEELGIKEKKFIKMGAASPTVLRTQYAYALFYLDEKAAEKCRNMFERLCKSYPFSEDVESEKELIYIAEAKHSGMDTKEEKIEDSKV